MHLLQLLHFVSRHDIDLRDCVQVNFYEVDLLSHIWILKNHVFSVAAHLYITVKEVQIGVLMLLFLQKERHIKKQLMVFSFYIKLIQKEYMVTARVLSALSIN